MTTISVAELRQNPAPALDAVERGQELTVTRYRRPIARIIPAASPAVSGVDVIRALASAPVDTGWATELEADRSADRGDDPWDR